MNTATAEAGTARTADTANHAVVSPDRWIAERKALLAHEKELTRLRDEIARKRRALPWERVATDYVFDAPEGRRALSDLFEGRRQLLVQHFMTSSSCCRCASATARYLSNPARNASAPSATATVTAR